MSKLRTDDPMHPESLPFTVWEVQAPKNDPDHVPPAIAIHACAGNIYVAWAAYDTLRERTPSRYLILVDCGRVIARSWCK